MTPIDRITTLYAALHPKAAKPPSVRVDWQQPPVGPHGYVALVSGWFFGGCPEKSCYESAAFTTAGAAIAALAMNLTEKVRARKVACASALRKTR